MSFVIADPESLAAASQDLGGIGSAIREATAAAYLTTELLSAAESYTTRFSVSGRPQKPRTARSRTSSWGTTRSISFCR